MDSSGQENYYQTDNPANETEYPAVRLLLQVDDKDDQSEQNNEPKLRKFVQLPEQ